MRSWWGDSGRSGRLSVASTIHQVAFGRPRLSLAYWCHAIWAREWMVAQWQRWSCGLSSGCAVSDQFLGVENAGATELIMMCNPVRDRGPAKWHREIHPIDTAPFTAMIPHEIRDGCLCCGTLVVAGDVDLAAEAVLDNLLAEPEQFAMPEPSFYEVFAVLKRTHPE